MSHCPMGVSTRPAWPFEFFAWLFLLWPRLNQNSCWINLKGGAFWENLTCVVTSLDSWKTNWEIKKNLFIGYQRYYCEYCDHNWNIDSSPGIFKSLHCKLFTVSWWHTSFFIDRFHAYFANHTIGDCCPYHKYFGTVEQIRIGWVLSLSTFAYGVCKKYKCLQLIAIWNNLKNRLVKVERFVSYRHRRINDSQMN